MVRCGWRCWFWLSFTCLSATWSSLAWAGSGGRITGISFEFLISMVVTVGGAIIAGYTRGVDNKVIKAESKAAAEAEAIRFEQRQQQAQINLLREKLHDDHPSRTETSLHREFVESTLTRIEREAREGIQRLEHRIDTLLPSHQHKRADDGVQTR